MSLGSLHFCAIFGLSVCAQAARVATGSAQAAHEPNLGKTIMCTRAAQVSAQVEPNRLSSWTGRTCGQAEEKTLFSLIGTPVSGTHSQPCLNPFGNEMMLRNSLKEVNFSRIRLYRKQIVYVSDSGRYVSGIGRYGREIHSRRYTGPSPDLDLSHKSMSQRPLCWKSRSFGYFAVGVRLKRDIAPASRRSRPETPRFHWKFNNRDNEQKSPL
ncbi:hypothetical protein TEA_014875 [Camellia sinensis var. sinensis]|uniref:Uncharacterized protein n=1 Tax=Camellia sinensis var. sinensis TaxID=542762 RepID=A0A4S4D5M0_CAMSN|nr:hypothetical protein TEA_014875 [Camellia sinensis var. sinensis]